MDIDPASLSPRAAHRLAISCVAPRPIAFVLQDEVLREGRVDPAQLRFERRRLP